MTAGYDPFTTGPFEVDVDTTEALDQKRNRVFPLDVWSPRRTDAGPAVIYSHYSGGSRRAATFLCRHLASHGYTVAAMDHIEVVAAQDLPADRPGRIRAVIEGRVPDVRFLIDHLGVDEVGLVGHSFGGWTVLAAAESDRRVASIVTMGPGGNSSPRPGILPLTLTFERVHEVPTLFLAAENDVPIPLDGVLELYARAPEPKRMFILRRADHQHFLDDVEGAHEAVRGAQLPREAAWIPSEMKPITDLSTGEQAHTFVRSLTLAHLDATLRRLPEAERFLNGDVPEELAARGVDATRPSTSTSSR